MELSTGFWLRIDFTTKGNCRCLWLVLVPQKHENSCHQCINERVFVNGIKGLNFKMHSLLCKNFGQKQNEALPRHKGWSWLVQKKQVVTQPDKTQKHVYNFPYKIEFVLFYFATWLSKAQVVEAPWFSCEIHLVMAHCCFFCREMEASHVFSSGNVIPSAPMYWNLV